MANVDRADGFTPINLVSTLPPNKYTMAADETTKKGDIVFIDSDGLITGTAGIIAGIQASAFWTPADGSVNATSVAGDEVMIYDDPFLVFRAQISTFTATDPYTTRSSAACYDVAGSAGAQYINAAASTQDLFKIMSLTTEPNTPAMSVAGANAKVLARFNILKHMFGCIA